jgi:PEP-CTERM motif
MMRWLMTTSAVVALAGYASANPLCTTNSLAYYISNYTSAATACVVNDKLFYNFGYSATAGSGTGTPGSVVAPTAAQITVNGDISDPNQPALVFASSGWTVSGSSSLAKPLFIDSNIAFTVAVIGLQPLMVGASLDMTGSSTTSGKGVASIGETLILGGGPASAALGVDSVAGPLLDSKTFAPVSFVRVSKDLIVHVPRPASGTNTGSSTITSFREGFTEISNVPEPVSAMLFGSGLIGLALIRRRRR